MYSGISLDDTDWNICNVDCSSRSPNPHCVQEWRLSYIKYACSFYYLLAF